MADGFPPGPLRRPRLARWDVGGCTTRLSSVSNDPIYRTYHHVVVQRSRLCELDGSPRTRLR